MVDHITLLRENPEHFYAMNTEEMFDLDPAAVEALQLDLLRRRFAELRPKVKVLDKLCIETGIDRIDSIDDVVPLALPHTMYKSYRATDIDKMRFDRMTAWLDALTAYDLSGIDVSSADSIEGWINLLEAETPMRPVSSSGTLGKISVLPRGLPEDRAQLHMLYCMFEPYRDEPGVDLRDGTAPFLCPWPSDSGRQAFINTIQILRDGAYPHDPGLVRTVGKGRISADELKLASRLRRAETLGEQLELSDQEKGIAEMVAERNRAMPDRMDRFIAESVIGLKGQRVVLFGFWTQIFELARACRQKGVTVEWAPDSLIETGGGTKGFVFPDGWRELIDDVFPFALRENYGMSETTAISIGCREGMLHPLPWGIKHVVDPATSQPLPRTGVQTGRLMVHDLLSTSLWPTTLTGDEVTIDWDGGCGCGRKGPFFHNNIQRIGEATGDDKITCAKTPQAYERLEAFALNVGG